MKLHVLLFVFLLTSLLAKASDPAIDYTLVTDGAGNPKTKLNVGGGNIVGTLPAARMPGAVQSSIATVGRNIPATPMEGATVVAYGNSYLAVNYTQTTRRYIDRLSSRIQSAGLTNNGVGGWLAGDCCAFAFGSFTANTATGVHAGTWQATQSNRGLAVLEVARNDAGRDSTATSGGTTAKSRAGFTTALDALIRLLRAAARIEDTSAGFAYSGGWGQVGSSGNPDSHASGGTVHYTANPGATCTITTPVGTDFDLILYAVDASAAGGNGSAYSVSVDGGAAITGTTNNQFRSPGDGAATATCQYAVPLRGLSNSAHTVVLTHTGAAGDTLFLDCLLTASPVPLTIVIPHVAYLGTAGYTNYTSSGGTDAGQATDDIYDGLIDQVIARFPADGSIVAWDPNNNGWNPATMLWSGDGVHPNDQGMSFYTDGLVGLLNTLPFRAGLNSATAVPGGTPLFPPCQAPHLFYATPVSGAGTPSWRAFAASDLPGGSSTIAMAFNGGSGAAYWASPGCSATRTAVGTYTLTFPAFANAGYAVALSTSSDNAVQSAAYENGSSSDRTATSVKVQVYNRASGAAVDVSVVSATITGGAQ